MRDYKLRKKVFNDYPNKAEVAEMIEAGGGEGLPEIFEPDEGKVLAVKDGEWSKIGVIDSEIRVDDTSQSPTKKYWVRLKRQGKIVRITCSNIPLSLFATVVIPKGYRPSASEVSIMPVSTLTDNSWDYVVFDSGTNKFSYNGSSTDGFMINFTYFTGDVFPSV